MNRKSIITLSVLLAIAGAISYGIIWWRNKKAGTLAVPDAEPSITPIVIDTQVGSALPKIESYEWWINKLGHASFPLGMLSRGVEVVKVQEGLNILTKAKRLNAGSIAVDGVWGNETDTRFKTLFLGFNQVSRYMFITDFDTNGDILK